MKNLTSTVSGEGSGGITLSRRRFVGAGVALVSLLASPPLGEAWAGSQPLELGSGIVDLRVRIGGSWLKRGEGYQLRGGRLSLSPRALSQGGEALEMFYQDRAGSWHERRVRLG